MAGAYRTPNIESTELQFYLDYDGFISITVFSGQ